MSLIDRDKMMNADRRRVANATMGVIDAAQRFRPEEQALGMAAAFLILCQEAGVNPQDAWTMTNNVMHDRTTGQPAPQFRAVAAYIRNELK